ncbi:pantoate--beta-alanine ligase [Chryseobacterium sp. POL2]|uniref:pantoate--beta-alanine ligase n=1 Tax=Chryseobacterium sp. POL2 TaxID=2713414 RepID=UPI0013E153BF|nr:pantoate--beta-alanine ligase [Chryseobacterium sp. POL2]QIG89466.1 pantoate--beta-alanine ligase [Chryseobacterium sp. POL2]
MKILNNKAELLDFVADIKKQNKNIGFAPTMGALHNGHLSLYKVARENNDIVISSIFVNPTQFNNREDLEKYPRTIAHDIEKLKNSELVDAVYIPTVNDIYPNGLSSKQYNFNGLENEMEGAARPGHFDGVGTVIEALFGQIQPDDAYFGEKDYQQLKIIETLVKNLKLSVKIHGVAIHRQEDGLAMSSRNARLNNEEKNASTIIYKTLKQVNDWFRVISIPEIKERVVEIFEKQDNMELEYFLIADEENLKETDFFYKDKNYRAFIVVNVGKVRLIDNIHLE